jgi:hypothetical protein
MEPLFIILPGIAGGIVLAMLISRMGTPRWGLPNDEHLEPPSTSIINMARIRVSGVGGLGMVALSIVVALFVPRIRLSIGIALALGIGLAAVLIAMRRRRGPLPSSNTPGAHGMLPLDTSKRP